MYRDETIDPIEPMLPLASRELEDPILVLIQQASELKAMLKPLTADRIRDNQATMAVMPTIDNQKV